MEERLQKIISSAGICSRRKAEELAPSAYRTDDPSILCDQFSMFRLGLQADSSFSSFIQLYSKIVRARARAFL